MKKRSSHIPSPYISAAVAFLLFCTVSLFVFIYMVSVRIGSNVKDTIRKNIQNQGEQFTSMLQTQIRMLESAADYIGKVDGLYSEASLSLIRSVSLKSDFDRVMIISPDGSGYTSDEASTNVEGRDYFRRSMQGETVVSDPLESSVDGESKVVISLPIRSETGEIIGVLGGSYDVGNLASLLFEDLYEGQGYSFIMTGDGSFICADSRLLSLFQSGHMQEDRIPEKDGYARFFSGLTEKYPSGSCIRISFYGEKCYLGFSPLSLNNWVVCYMVPIQAAGSSYAFIRHYEYWLVASLFTAGMVLFLFLLIHSQRAQKKLLRKAQTDPLTGISNRNSVTENIRDWLLCPQCHEIQALFMIDIDNFKTINDTCGHAAGDRILCAMAETLRSNFRESDVIGRIGGDEFIVLMKNIHGRENAFRHMEMLRTQFIQNAEKLELACSVSCSIGTSLYPEDGLTFEELYDRADIALYRSKSAGRNRCCFFSGPN